MPPDAPAAALPAAAAAPAPAGDGAARIAEGAAAAASAPEKEGDSDDFEDISGEVWSCQGFLKASWPSPFLVALGLLVCHQVVPALCGRMDALLLLDASAAEAGC